VESEMLMIKGYQAVENHVYKTFKTQYSGYIGIQPYTADPASKQANFLCRLAAGGFIDHMVVSVFAKKADVVGFASTIKFGSYDPINIKPGS
jgi:hypothetical protein